MIENFAVSQTISLHQAIDAMDRGGHGFVIALDDVGRVTGLLTDGDFRRAMLNGAQMDTTLADVMNKEFHSMSHSATDDEIYQELRTLRRRHMPVLDDDGVLVDIKLLDDVEFVVSNEHVAVIMAGGLGTRLGELTKDCPKPMLDCGGKPILENILINLKDQGFRKFVFCVNYLSEMIQEYFGNGENWGVEISYTCEEKRLGTAGALSLLESRPTRPFVVMNGDLLTKVNFRNLIRFHEDHAGPMTIGVRQYQYAVPFGVIQHEDGEIVSLEEKPVHTYSTNAGIYVLNPECLDYIPSGEYHDMTQLIDDLLIGENKPLAYPIHEEWLDVGRPEDLSVARSLKRA